MTPTRLALAAAAGLLIASAAARADDCADVRAAMIATAQTPYATTTTVAGTGTTIHIVQTATNKYVERGGKWYALPITPKDLIDNIKAMKLITCTRGGSDSVGGTAATIYTVHGDSGGTPIDVKAWVSARHLSLKTTGKQQGADTVTLYDYTHVQPPANAQHMGG